MTTPTLLSYNTLQERFKINDYNILHDNESSVIFFDGDTTLTQDLNQEWAQTLLSEMAPEASTDTILIVVHGTLTVKGDINIGDYQPSLLVIGNVHCDVLVSGDDTMHITGDAHITHAFYGHYNDGSVSIDGITYVPYLINSDHSSGITPSGAIVINAYSDHHDFFDYDYLREALPAVVVPEALNKDNEFDAWRFIELVRSGKSPFVEGAKPMSIANAEALAVLTSGDIEAVHELNWSDKNVKVFPDAIIKLTSLRKLDLSKNPITELPETIGELENLEELDLNNCRLTKLPNAIGNLKKLRILNLNVNSQLTRLPESFATLINLQTLKLDHIPLTFPDNFDRLENLETISMYKCYSDRKKPALFPDVLTRMKNLRHLDLRENALHAIPDSLLNVQTLETFSWTGSSTEKDFTFDFAGFKNLKTLIISRKFNAWKDRVFSITSLEHLSIDRNKEEKNYITQDLLDTYKGMITDDASREHFEWMNANKQTERDGRLFILLSPGMNPEDLRDINHLTNLKSLDLSFNHLTSLPDTFFELKHLENLDLRYNKFPEAVKEQITNAFPNTTIVWQ